MLHSSLIALETIFSCFGLGHGLTSLGLEGSILGSFVSRSTY